MSNPEPINLHEPDAETAASAVQIGKKVFVVALAALTISAMIAWCGLLGWGAIELLWLAVTAIHRLWTGSL